MIKEIYDSSNGATAICICDKCGKKFNRAFSIAKKSVKHYCSTKCAGTESRPIRIIELTCSYCNKYFSIEKNHVDLRQKLHFCSGVCERNYCIENNLPVKGEWKGLRRKQKSGYIMRYIPEYSKDKSVVVPEHRYVMENHLGRRLKPHEHVHHINGKRDDNRIDNLELWTKSHPRGQRIEDKIKWAIEILNEYGYEVSKK